MICVDASLAVKWVLTDEVRAQDAIALIRAQLTARQEMVAPPLFYSEATNILRKRVRETRLPISLALDMLEDFMALPVTLLSPAELFHDALWLASRYNLAATYDAQYVVLAQMLECEFWTDDHRLVNSLQSSLPFVRALSEYSP